MFLRRLQFIPALLLTGLLMNGCGLLKPPPPELLAKRKALIGNLYIRIEKPASSPSLWDHADTSLSKQLANSEEPPVFPVKMLGRSVGGRIKSLGGSVLAVRMATGPATADRFTSVFKPMGVLNIRCTGFDYNLEKPTGSADASNPPLTLVAEMTYEASLVSATDGEVVWKCFQSARAQTGLSDVRDLNEDRYQKLEQSVFNEASRQMAWGLGLPQTAPVETPRPEWFSKKLALLPFSDSTTSVDAPDIVRAALFAELADAGYSIMPLADIDDILKKHGISEGGQLRAVTDKNLADWLGTDMLVNGDVEDFGETNIGILHSRKVGGTIEIKTIDWSSHVNVTTGKTAFNKSSIVDNFLGGLLHAWEEKISKSPLGPEVHRFAAESVETLPFLP